MDYREIRALSIIDMRKGMKTRTKSQANIEMDAEDSDNLNYSKSDADPLTVSEESGRPEIIEVSSGKDPSTDNLDNDEPPQTLLCCVRLNNPVSGSIIHPVITCL